MKISTEVVRETGLEILDQNGVLGLFIQKLSR